MVGLGERRRNRYPATMATGIEHLLAEGILSEVLGRLRSGKEADVYVVRYGQKVVAAKVYKDRAHRSFKNNAVYKEGRSVRNSRSQRAIDKGSRFGKDSAEDAWKSAEVDGLYKLHAAGVRVPTPVMFLDGVLLMELVAGADGEPAPRLVDTQLTAAEANVGYHDMLKQLVLILSCELIHGDLSPYNVLLGAQGHTIIDFPQIISASHNSQSEMFFLRDARNILGYYASIDPSLAARQSDPAEIWRAYVRRELSPDFMPSGRGGPPARTEARPPQRAHAGPPARTHAGPLGAPPARPQAGPHGGPHQRTHGSPPPRSHGGAPQRTQGGPPARTQGGAPPRTQGGPPARTHGGPARTHDAPARTPGGPPPRTHGEPASHGQIGGPAFPSRIERGSSARNNQPRPAPGPGGHGGRSQAPIRHGGQHGGGSRPPANVRGPRMPEVIVLANRPLQSPVARPAAEDRTSPVPGAPSNPAPSKGPRRRRRRGGGGAGGAGGAGGGQR